MNNFTRVFLKQKEEKEVLQGFPWVFDNEISHIKYFEKDNNSWKDISLNECTIEDGSIVEVFAKAGAFLGSGIINRKSKIIIRFISALHADKIFENKKLFIEKKIRDAINIRRINFTENDSYRVIFAEADFLPGLIVEKFCDIEGNIYLVVQFLALASEVFREEIINSLVKYCKPNYIYERSDATVREKEGLEAKSSWIYKTGKEVILISENNILFYIDIANGQKTGFFLDQKNNRKAIMPYCHGKKVLDAFSHTGAFGLYAAKEGAKEVIAAEISEDAICLINKNIAINKKENVMKAICVDVFDLLKEYEEKKETFDVIILDPPAFTKSAKNIQKAYSGYKEINLRAMRLLGEGGILISCSCSAFFDSTVFYDMLMHAATNSHRKVQVLEKRGASQDHPILLGYERSEYLKCAIMRVL